MQEEFRTIPSLNNEYEINSNGTILRRIITNNELDIKLDYHHSKKGYYYAWTSFHGKIKRLSIAALVAECWLGPKPKGLEIDHIDRNPHNNDYRNLRYVDHSTQMKNRKLSDKIINQARKNCLNYSKTVLAKPVIIVDDNVRLDSHMMAAKYLANKLGKNSETVRATIKQAKAKTNDDYIYVYGYKLQVRGVK